MRVERYTATRAGLWNQAIENAINGSFLFQRGFMDYHAHRFEDHSLLIFEGDTLRCVVPAHETSSGLCSHKGLSYGGFVWLTAISNYAQVMGAVRSYLKKQGLKSLEICLPPEYYDNQYNEHINALKGAGFKAIDLRRDMAVTLPYFKVSPKKTAGYRNGRFSGLRVDRSSHLDDFWDEVLVPCLKRQYDVAPVHSKDEIKLLKSRFPENIQLYTVNHDGKIVAGVLFFLNGRITKSQYAASTPTGRKLRALDFLYLEMMDLYKKGFNYMDYGTVHHDDGSINKSLQRYKAELGAHAYEQLTFVLQV